MECFFNCVNKRNCISFHRCEGIYNLALKLGSDEKFAQNYSKYILKLSILHKLRDKCRDTKSSSILSRSFKKILRVLYYLFSKIFSDTYQLENKLSQIELEIESLESNNEISNPIVYYRKVGEGYGLIFKYAAVGAKVNISLIKKLEILGNLIGTLVALRDSIIDLEEDRRKENFNPFKKWKEEEIRIFFNENLEKIQRKIENLTENNINEPTYIQKVGPVKANLRSIISYSIAPAILNIPALPPANLMQFDCCSSCCTDCTTTSCCPDCDCPEGTCPSCESNPGPTILICASIGCISLCILGIALRGRGKGKGSSGGGGCGGGGGCDCSGCDCDCGGCT